MLYAIRRVFEEKMGRAFWEAVTDSPEQANEAQAMEEMAIQANKSSAEGMPGIGPGE